MKRDEKIKELLEGTELSDLEFTGHDTAGGLLDALEEQINEAEIIYYNRAMEYLSENDASLRDSLALAADMGYELRSLNSETLATLLQQQNMRNELARVRGDLEEIYDAEPLEDDDKEAL